METHGRTVVDHEVIAAVGFDHVTERGEGFFGQRFDLECAHAGLLIQNFVLFVLAPSRASPLPHLKCIPLWERACSRRARRLFSDLAKHPQATYTTIREHVQADVGNRSQRLDLLGERSEEHTSELQSLMR